MPIASQPFFNWLVRLLSGVLATVEPEGWLCERMIPEAWETRAVWRTMRMSTTVLFMPLRETHETPSSLPAPFRYIAQHSSWCCIQSS